MKTVSFVLLLILILGCTPQKKELNNTFYVFNNSVRTMLNPPQGMDEQAIFIKNLGFDGFAGHHSEEYFPRRTAMDKVGLAMPEVYWPVTIEEDGSVTYKEGLKELIEDSENRDLMVAVGVLSDAHKKRTKEVDALLVKAIQELADYAVQFDVKIGIYPHTAFYCERMDHGIDLVKMVDRPNTGAIFNVCHVFKVEGTAGWEKKLTEALPHLYMISISGSDSGDTQKLGWDQLIQPLGEGDFDMYQVVKLAKDNGFEGLFGLQCYNIQQDCETALKKSMSTWKEYQKRYSGTE